MRGSVTLFYMPMIVGLLVLTGLVVFFWKRYGPGSGRGLGRRIAAHIGISSGVFYALLDNGVKGSSREALSSLEAANIGLEEACVRLAPSLSRGLERLEARFGPQEMYEKAKPAVARLVAEAEREQGAAGPR